MLDYYKATIAQKACAKVIYKFLSIYMYLPFAIFPQTNSPEKWKKRDFTVFPSCILRFWAPYARHSWKTQPQCAPRGLCKPFTSGVPVAVALGTYNVYYCWVAGASALHVPAAEQLVLCWQEWELVDAFCWHSRFCVYFFFNSPWMSLPFFSGHRQSLQ